MVQVLHHISSVARRRALLAQLAGLLRPGGRALVTAWATQQEEPGKLAKWEPICKADMELHSRPQNGAMGSHARPQAQAGSSQQQARDQMKLVESYGKLHASEADRAQTPQPGQAGPLQPAPATSAEAAELQDVGGGQAACLLASCQGSMAGEEADRSSRMRPGVQASSEQVCARDEGQEHQVPSRTAGAQPQPQSEQGSGNNYFVPWHLPFHRAEAAAAVAAAQGSAGSAEACKVVDKAKGTVVFRRFYHLFEPGELEGLVEAVPGVQLEASFFDKSNWCVVMRKV